MPKTGSTDDPRPPRVSAKMLEDIKAILQQQQPPVALDNESLKAQLKAAGHSQATGGHIDEALQMLQA